MSTTWSAALKHARQQQGLSLAQAASRLNLPEQALVTLEREALTADDLTPYLRGYLNNYCRLLGLPPPVWPQESVIPTNSTTQRTTPRALHGTSRQGWLGKQLLVGVGIVLVLALIGAMVHHQWHKHSQSTVSQRMRS